MSEKPKRDRTKEREANRLRMAERRTDPEYRAKVNARRAIRDAERKATDKALRHRLTANGARYYTKRAADPEFWVKRKAYLTASRANKRDDEAFEAYMERIMREQELEACQ